jgi:hypothetical protein
MFSTVVESRLKGELPLFFFAEYNSSLGNVTMLPPHNPFGNGGINGRESA